MKPLMLINLDDMKPLAIAEGDKVIRRLEYIADIMIPKGEPYICNFDQEALATFSEMEQRLMYEHLHGDKIKTAYLPQMAEKIYFALGRMELDTRPLEELMLALKGKSPSINPEPQPERGGKASTGSKLEGKPTSRPKAGSTTGKVWEIADWFYVETPEQIHAKEFREKVINKCVENDINSSTASTQFAKWKRHHLSS